MLFSPAPPTLALMVSKISAFKRGLHLAMVVDRWCRGR